MIAQTFAVIRSMQRIRACMGWVLTRRSSKRTSVDVDAAAIKCPSCEPLSLGERG
jgi:hypothetical protein